MATEDVVYMLQGMGYDLGGVDLAKVIKTGNFISEKLNRPNMSKVAKALSSKL